MSSKTETVETSAELREASEEWDVPAITAVGNRARPWPLPSISRRALDVHPAGEMWTIAMRLCVGK